MDDSALVAYGFDARVGRLYADEAHSQGIRGRVSRVDRGECAVVTAEGLVRVASDSQRSQGALAPATGDWVVVGNDPGLGQVIEEVLPRRTALVRRDPAEEVVEQVLAANIDVVAAVHGLDRPLRPGRIERFLVLAWDSGAEPAIVVTKADLGGAEAVREELASLFDGVPVFVVSAVSGEGLDEIGAFVADAGTIVLVGESGAGKSMLANALVGEELQTVGDVRDGDAKGRHTTTTRDLIPLPDGGVLIDTPGVRAVGLWEADAAIDRVFRDIASAAEACRFRDCSHTVEPGCAVVAGVEAGDLDAAQVERYTRLRQELDEQAADIEERSRRNARGRRRQSTPKQTRRT